MPRYSLSVPDRAPLEFQGQLLTSVDSKRIESPRGGDRGYRLLVYSCDEGGYVPAIVYQTTVPDEISRTLAESVDTVSDVEDFFFAFEPDELLTQSKSSMTTDVRQELLQRLYAHYDGGVKEVLKQLRSLPKASVPSVGR